MDIRYEHLKFDGGSAREGEASPPPTETLAGVPNSVPKDPAMFPAIPAELVAALDTLFPESSPDAGESLTQLMWRGGQRSVVRWLRSEYLAQLKGAS